MPEQTAEPGQGELIQRAISSNAFITLDPWYESTGFRTHQLAHANAGRSGVQPAEEFLLNSRLVRGDAETAVSVEAYFRDASVAMLSLRGLEAETGIGRVGLPAGPVASMAIGEAISRRRSVRTYTGDTVPFEVVASLLRGAAGITGTASVQMMAGGQATLRYRAVPSGGGLYPIDLYLGTMAVDGLDRGIYKAAPVDDAFIQVGDDADLVRLLRGFAAPEELISLSRAAAVVVLVGHGSRSTRKYGARGVRLMLLEAGAIAEHLNLMATALGLGSVDCSSFFEDEVDEALGLDCTAQSSLHTVIIGEPA